MEEKEAGEFWTPVTDGAAEVELLKVVSTGVTRLTSVLRKPKSLQSVDITFASFAGAIIVNQI